MPNILIPGAGIGPESRSNCWPSKPAAPGGRLGLDMAQPTVLSRPLPLYPAPPRSLTSTQVLVVVTAVPMPGTLAVTLAGSIAVKFLIAARCT